MANLYRRRFRPGTALAWWLLGAAWWCPPAVFSQEVEAEDPEQAEQEEVSAPRYDLGDSALSIRLGAGFPLFLLATEAVETYKDGSRIALAPNLSVMGTGAVSWNAYLNPSFTLGMEVSGAVAGDINQALLYLVPILVRGGYVINTPQFEIPLMLGLGATVMRLVDKTSVAFALQPAASFLWRATEDWSFGVTAEYWFTWEPPWSGGEGNPHIFGNFVTATATAVYHF